MNNPSLSISVVIPAYNEEKRLPNTLRATIEYLKASPHEWEILVVNDGSHDKTADIVREYAIQDKQVKLLEYGKNHGKGYAVRYGMTHATGDIQVFMDADNSTSIDHIEKFLPYTQKGFDVVIGSRDVDGADISVHQPKYKELLGDLGNLWIQLWAVPGIKDTQAGFKMFTKKASQNVFPYLTIDRWGFDVEALAVARMKGYSISEQPITWINDPNSKVAASAYVEVLKEVVQVRINILRGVYGRAA
ncbi:MAG: hypothetical protein A3C02_01300 [Candidatus Andersenbacteria bacterium RIFCSPHIGHO2_02_FULL_45_11]|uniref:dolichyl-phosphate beta-glucosyltransferase n=1 Tax=Candidatus Andersenbacteria bacterium RIFCSPHIGHO2_12_FULL_45_11 TaxID=1797281 RepID=A0A1G1X3I0_9BACT|nr:MAG: hypothetical protein A2805_00080 [Candidatus Andersenbacteria bacterium RIFCSPHIGHO2_01_FULL_46_36]OGY34361.1 MAG: hypothetical protein A3D99_02510 [Candidatus Andersenbacteria bacterium RIFCSPHIGHO2_12_FULL_45_11]OGY34940.1 MAG: hypothetical protein A3C02_01300 [Candidatus Andersenbacteria bacterium RIFCSPHIGHO2_02_FULL_45_11]